MSLFLLLNKGKVRARGMKTTLDAAHEYILSVLIKIINHCKIFFGTPICNCTLQIWIFLDITSGKSQYVSVSQHMMETWAVIGHPSALVTWWYHCKLKFNSMTWYWYCHQCNQWPHFKDISHWDNYDGNFLTGQLIILFLERKWLGTDNHDT